MIIRHAEKLSCLERSVSYWLWLDLQCLLVSPLPFTFHYDLRAMPHGQQPAHLLIQRLVLPVQTLTFSRELSLLLLPLLNGDPLRAGDSVPFLQHPPRSLESPQVCLVCSLELLPPTLPVNGVQLFLDGLRPQEGFAQPDHLVKVADPLCTVTHLILQAASLAGDAIQPGFLIIQRFNVVIGQIRQGVSELFCVADLRLFTIYNNNAIRFIFAISILVSNKINTMHLRLMKGFFVNSGLHNRKNGFREAPRNIAYCFQKKVAHI